MYENIEVADDPLDFCTHIHMYAEADYSEGTTAYMWITNKIQKIADRIRDTEKAKITSSASGVPHHLV